MEMYSTVVWTKSIAIHTHGASGFHNLKIKKLPQFGLGVLEASPWHILGELAYRQTST